MLRLRCRRKHRRELCLQLRPFLDERSELWLGALVLWAVLPLLAARCFFYRPFDKVDDQDAEARAALRLDIEFNPLVKR